MMLRMLLAAGLATGLALPARADLAFGFDDGSQGWAVEAGGTLVHRAAGGAPGGFLEFTDLDSQDMLAVLSPGGADWSVFVGGTLHFDAKILSNHVGDWPGFGEVALSGAGGSVIADMVPPGQPLANGQWQHFSVPLTVAVFGNTLPAVLASVSLLSIKTEFAVSDPGIPASFETLGLDNVRIAAVSEPPNWALLLAGGLLLPALRHRCRG